VTTDPAGLTGTLGGFNNVIDAGAGDDVVEAGDEHDTVHGGSGNDSLYGGAGYDTLYGDDGNDVLQGSGNDSLCGGAGRDTLIGGDNLAFDWVILDGGSGADRMIGGKGQQFYLVDSYADVVVEKGDSEEDYDNIVTNLNYTLSEGGGIENLILGDAFLGLLPTARSVYGGGNSHDNIIAGNAYANVLDGKGGNDFVYGDANADLVMGGAGDDIVHGADGSDIVRGQDGDDLVAGGVGQDVLVGGRGNDLFRFREFDSGPGAVDAIKAGDCAVAFEGAGQAEGDRIDLWPIYIHIPEEDTFVYVPWVFGETGLGGLSCVEAAGGRTLVRGNIDDDPAFEFKLLIEDRQVQATDYTVDDFLI
jgi:Ca2+-binding RTX toxin-like protein